MTITQARGLVKKSTNLNWVNEYQVPVLPSFDDVGELAELAFVDLVPEVILEPRARG